MHQPPVHWLNDAEVVVVGAGLMGASLALALRGKVKTLNGVEVNPRHRQLAASCFDHLFADLDAVRSADLVILATPVRAILTLLEPIAALARPGAVIMDLGSAKTAICSAMDNLPERVEAIGGHPMCGKEKSGPEAADAALYHRRRFVLCPTRRTTPHSMHLAQQVVSAARSQLVVMQPEEHDSAVAAISHLPYLISAALVDTVKALVDSDADDSQAPWQLAATGFHDTSRLAGSDVTMMADTLDANRDAVLHVLSAYQDSLARFRALLEAQDSTELRTLLEHIRSARQDWLEQYWKKTVD